MKFEFTVYPGFSFRDEFAEKFDLEITRNRVIIPDRLGQGYIKEINTNNNLKLVIHHYRLKEEFYQRRLGSSEQSSMVSVVFNSHEIPTGEVNDKENLVQSLNKNESTIQVASSLLGTETVFPANKDIRFMVVGVRRPALKSLLQAKNLNNQVQTILNSKSTFFYHEQMSADIQRIFDKLFLNTDRDKLVNLFYRYKTEELIYHLFSQLLHRENAKQLAINKDDIMKLNNVHAAIIKDTSEPPKIDELTKKAGMSKTKMKQLFKQIYGDSIYNYYLNARMEDAAYLLKHANLPVSEVGFRVGYTNLSHFSRMFRKHYGKNPKKYSSDG